MNLADIETFLSIVNTKSITKTADLLFLSQPTVSHRLSSLEKDLGFSLVIRQKGHKQVELTPKGQEFISIAERWISLWKETQILQYNEDRMLLTIGCTDSLNNTVMAPFYRLILKGEYPLDLKIETHQSAELYSILSEHDIDIGFVYHHLNYKNIISEKLFQEKLYLVQSDQPAVPQPLVHTNELDPTMELFLAWDDHYQIWHDRWLTASFRPHIAADTITLLDRLWEDPRHWMIAPISVIEELARFRPIYVSELKNPPPDRICYKIKHKFPNVTHERTVSYFEQLLDDYLAAHWQPIKVGEVWGGSQ
ncbi:LysR family transcriptional regulator [Gehongia tenuis]|uniref:LysR family transcriptional regulator n=1 Tax=Gehongia tenuis TaxID=2763655 RepID=A0A926D4E2_9FIRM|nr:LysR family transcriptional regulator [Gehongia tenuis]MBC8531361.1 LysR family transcriptional regulator [Gehongia tenuis]